MSDLNRSRTSWPSIVNRTYQRGGKIIVPAFAVGRTQQLVLLLHELIERQADPRFPIFVDSPLAVKVTEVFRKHPELFDRETRSVSADHEDPFGFSRLTYIRDVEQSKALNDLRGPSWSFPRRACAKAAASCIT